VGGRDRGGHDRKAVLEESIADPRKGRGWGRRWHRARRRKILYFRRSPLMTPKREALEMAVVYKKTDVAKLLRA
jgi:hypothetical protein